MRGRLWLLWSTMTFGGLFTCLMGTAGDSFGKTIAFVILAAAGIEVIASSRPCVSCKQTDTAHYAVSRRNVAFGGPLPYSTMH